MKSISVLADLGDKKIELKTGDFAQQASSSVMATMGETVVMATVTVAKKENKDIDYFPLMVDYEEKMYAAGKILGSRFIKREGRPTEEAILTGRMIDRSIRPLFPKEFKNDVQVVATVLSIDGENDPDILAIIASSTALCLSEAPFEGPISALRIAKAGKDFIINPTNPQREKAEFETVLSTVGNKISMIEAQGNEASENDIKKAFDLSVSSAKNIYKAQEELIKKAGKKKIEASPKKENKDVLKKVSDFASANLEKALSEKGEVKETLFSLYESIKDLFENENEQKEAVDLLDKKIREQVREDILKKDKRPDGRKLSKLREIGSEIGVLPRTHGSAMFRRGLTQALTITTLGSTADVQILDTMEQDSTKRYMHHYNFPPYSVGEVRPMRSPGRREIGHGALAEKAILPVLPDKEVFPYTIRVVTEILSSNGSTSMAAVCGSTLSLMDAGVPIKAPVAGISIGLVTSNDGKKYKLLTDIIGLEDFTGDMDFKVAGTKRGITAIQMDTKLKGVPVSYLKEGLDQAQKTKLEILEIIQKTIKEPKKELSKYAPRIAQLKIDQEKIKDVIGPGGKIINKIIEETGVEIDIEPDGTVMIFSSDNNANQKAVEWVERLTKDVEVGQKYEGPVTRVLNFGAMVEILPGKEGMVHISKLSKEYVKDIHKVVKVGDKMKVVVAEIDSEGRVNLSRADK